MTSPVESMLLRRLAAKKKSILLYCFSPIPFRKKRATFKLIYFIASFHFTLTSPQLRTSTAFFTLNFRIIFSKLLLPEIIVFTMPIAVVLVFSSSYCSASIDSRSLFLTMCQFRQWSACWSLFFSCWLRPKFNHVSRLRRDVISHNSRLLQMICGPAKR